MPLAAPTPNAPVRPSPVPPPVAPTQAQPEIRPQAQAQPKYEARAEPRPPAPVPVPVPTGPARPSAAPGPDQAAVSALPTAPKQARVDENAVLRRFADEISRVLGKSVSERDYPRLARQQNWQGTTEVRLQIGSDGKVKDVVVGRTSGYELLDQRAIELVKHLRLPKIPSAFRQREFTVTVPITFALRNS
jgi:protein TonB